MPKVKRPRPRKSAGEASVTRGGTRGRREQTTPPDHSTIQAQSQDTGTLHQSATPLAVPVSSSSEYLTPTNTTQFASVQNEAHTGTGISSVSTLSCTLDPIMPMSIGSTQFSLGYYVDSNTRDKIIAGKFINLGSLLVRDPNPTQNLSTLSIDTNGQLVTQPKPHPKITNIDKWTDAFVIFMSIYTGAHPEKVQSFLKYMHDIRLGAQRSLGWHTYDEQFRLRASLNSGHDWGVVDTELWMLYMTPNTQQPTMGKAAKCYEFNFQGSCKKPNCKYMHRCIRCNNSHSVNTCTAGQEDKSFRPFSSKTSKNQPSNNFAPAQPFRKNRQQ